MTATSVAAIARKAFDAVAAKVSGVIKDAAILRETVSGYDVDRSEVTSVDSKGKCRLVFARADAGEKYFPELVIAPPDELVFIEGAATLQPKAEDIIVVDNRKWKVKQPRDILQVAGLWAAVVRPETV